jgi:hypothetical protein
MPVFSVEAKYRKVLKYDELITIQTTLKDMPGARMEFYHKIYNGEGSLAHEAKVVLVFLNTRTNRPVRAPEALVKVAAGLFRLKGQQGDLRPDPHPAGKAGISQPPVHIQVLSVLPVQACPVFVGPSLKGSTGNPRSRFRTACHGYVRTG